MEACCKDAHLRWASRLLGLAGFLLGVCCIGPVSPGGADSRAHVSLERVQGGSVWFNVTQEVEGEPEAQLEEIAWSFGPETKYRLILRLHSGGDPLTWVSLQDKYKHRVRVPSMTSLLILNLTREDSGQYRVRGSFTGGTGFTQVFQLSVYDSQGQATGRHMAGIAGALMVVLLTVGAGLYFCKKRGKKKEMEAGTGAGLEDGHRVHEDGICYAELSQQVSQEGGDKGVREQPLEGKIPVTTIYSEVHRQGQAAKVI